MSNFASVNDVLGRQAASADLATWTFISPNPAGNRDRVFVQNFSSSPLFLKMVGTPDSAPTGTDTSVADLFLGPGEGMEIGAGASVAIYGIHGPSRVAGYCVREGQ